MKPDWKDAPEWAQWLAMDASGDWYWYEEEPSKGAYVFHLVSGRIASPEKTETDWRKSIEQRQE